MQQKIFKVMVLVSVLGSLFASCEEGLLDTNVRDELLGTWKVAEDNNLKSVEYYNVTISKSSSDTTKILIDHFYALSGVVEAKISGYTLNIPQQTVAGFTIAGYGSVSMNLRKIEWSYTVDYHNNFVDQVTATYTRP